MESKVSERRKWQESVVNDFGFDGYTLRKLQALVAEMIIEHGADAIFDYDYYGYNGDYDIKLKKTFVEDDSTYNERVVQEALKATKKKVLKDAKAQKDAQTIADKERKLYESLKEKYGNKED